MYSLQQWEISLFLVLFSVCASELVTDRICRHQPEEVAQVVIRVGGGRPSAQPRVECATHLFVPDGENGVARALAEPSFS